LLAYVYTHELVCPFFWQILEVDVFIITIFQYLIVFALFVSRNLISCIWNFRVRLPFTIYGY
jgi:hypothetical protein